MAEYVNKPYEKYEILNQAAELIGEPQVMEPEGLTQARKDHLKYFVDYVLSDHRQYIYENY